MSPILEPAARTIIGDRPHFCEDAHMPSPGNSARANTVERRRRETRTLKLMLVALAFITASVSVVLFTTTSLALLLLPFLVFVAGCAAVLPMDGFSRHVARESAVLQQQRRADAERHGIRPVVRANAPAQAYEEQWRQAMTAAQAYGIHFASAHLSDGDFLHRFTAGELRADGFRHGDHLRFAWLTLERLPFDLAEESIAQSLRTFLRRISGSNAQFHATHTHGWVRVLAAMPERSFANVLSVHASELQSNGLTQFWSADLLSSPAARAAVVGTDVASLPAPHPRRSRRYRAGNSSLPQAAGSRRLGSQA